MNRIKRARNAVELYNAAKEFNGLRVKLPHETPQCDAWIEAYKGAGAFYTMQNLVRFHNCLAIDDAGNRLNKNFSLTYISGKAEWYKYGEGWRMLGLLKKMLKDNNIDIEKKMAEWRN